MTGPKKKPQAVKIPATSRAARDAGPRLLPLQDRQNHPPGIDHYLELADIALGMKHSERRVQGARASRSGTKIQ
jgi:hypothetical protein